MTSKSLLNPNSSALYRYKLHSSIAEIDAETWHQIVDPINDLAMNSKLILLTEQSLTDQAKFWTVVFYHSNQAVACACLCLFLTDAVQSTPKFIRQTVAKLRGLRPDLFKLGVLFCGLPVPSAHTHIRFSHNDHIAPVLKMLTDIMGLLAHQEKASLLVFKELDQKQLQAYSCLHDHGFIHGMVAPMHELQFRFASFDDYYQALRSGYQHQIRKNLKKFKSSGLSIQHIDEPNEIDRHFTHEVHQLYIAVWQRAKERLEQFPLIFFKGLGHALPGNTILTIIHQHQKPIAFTIGIRNQHHYYNLYCGIDYSVNEALDLYFNLFYQELGQAFKQNLQSIFLGQTSDVFKARLGSTTTPRYFFVKAKNRLGQVGLKLLSPVIFPNPTITLQHSVLKS